MHCSLLYFPSYNYIHSLKNIKNERERERVDNTCIQHTLKSISQEEANPEAQTQKYQTTVLFFVVNKRMSQKWNK